MTKLKNIGFIKNIYIEKNGKPHRGYTIDDKGVDLIRPYLPYDVIEKRYISNSIEHDLVLSDINYVFEKLSNVQKVWTEAELMSYTEAVNENNLLPFIELRTDRVCLVVGKVDTKYLALEYEKTLKADFRNKSKIEMYYLQNNIPSVLYVCESEKIIKSLMKADRQICKDRNSKIYFCHIDDVLKNNKNIIFQNINGHKLDLK